MDSEESGSEYEDSSDEALNPSAEIRSNPSTFTSEAPKLARKPSILRAALEKFSAEDTPTKNIEDATAWAARFQAPPSPGEISFPARKAARVHPRVKRAKVKQPASIVRAKRLRSYYSDDYRTLLNENIQDALSGVTEDEQPLENSQIGSCYWTSSEKYMFFSALSRLGRDDHHGVAASIGTKSVLEVHDYIHHLSTALQDKQIKGARLLQSVELPAALEISDECNSVLERAGQAINVREELAAEKVEKRKWGDSWLVTRDVSRWVEKRIKQNGGEEEIEEVMAAANLLKLSNWLELQKEIFMNPGPGHEDDNWTNIAEEDETPAIRATALEDFHSLAVNITKRLVSTALFCTMSRLKAKEANIVKHAEVRPSDVEAAVQILSLKSSSNEFWINCARRCNLAVIDDESKSEIEERNHSEEGESLSSLEGHDTHMTYSAIELDLRNTKRPSNSRSRSVSRPPLTSSYLKVNLEPGISSPEEYISNPPSPHSAHSPQSSAYSSHSAHSASPSHSSGQEDISTPAKMLELENNQDDYAGTMDLHHSRVEETRLWAMLHQSPPFEIDIPSIDGLEKPRHVPADIEGRDWRERVEFGNTWEVFERPVGEEAFVRNRTRLSRSGKRKSSVAFADEEEEEEEEEEEDEDTEENEDQEEIDVDVNDEDVNQGDLGQDLDDTEEYMQDRNENDEEEEQNYYSHSYEEFDEDEPYEANDENESKSPHGENDPVATEFDHDGSDSLHGANSTEEPEDAINAEIDDSHEQLSPSPSHHTQLSPSPPHHAPNPYQPIQPSRSHTTNRRRPSNPSSSIIPDDGDIIDMLSLLPDPDSGDSMDLDIDDPRPPLAFDSPPPRGGMLRSGE